MNCEEASLLLEEFYDGEVDTQSKLRIEAHLAVCPSCGVEFERMRRLDNLLEKSSTPQASAQLDRTLMAAFRRQHEKAAPSPPWWQRIFVGSVSIPKPAFAAVLLAIVLAVLAAGIGESNRSIPAQVGTNIPSSSPASATPLPPEIIEKTRIVEVPVVRERVVTRVVYVERQNSRALARNRVSENKQTRAAKEGDANLAMSGAVEDGEYVTRANLAGFQPMAELKTRIILNR